VAVKILVTGAASGIGRAVLDGMGARGFSSVGWDVSGQDPVDVSDEDQVRIALARIAPVPEAVVCVAGVLSTGSLTDVDAAEWTRVLSVNVMGAVFVLRELARAWEAAGARGRAVVVSSMAGERGSANSVAYCASKAALNGMVKATALDWAPLGHRINAVLPGSVDTPMLDTFIGHDEHRLAALITRQPLGRLARPSEIADLCAFLVSDQSSYLTGALVPIDGALTLGYG
jgi:NAD(P)-dependent dehydrogenase (short-subunit alcohol dehydrogenase family)